MIEQTKDFRRVNRLAAEPPIISNKLVFLVENIKGRDVGLWTLQEFGKGFMIHADMGNACRGRDAILSAKNAFQWSFHNLKTDFIFALIPKANQPACQIAARSGMKFKNEVNHQRFYEVKNG